MESTEPLPCDEEVYKSGSLVMMTHSIPSAKLEAWVKSVALLSEQRVDWHFVGGRACILAIGDLSKVRVAIAMLLPEHDRLQRKEHERYIPELPFTPSYTIYEDHEWNPAHEWARQAKIAEQEAANV